MNDAIEFLAITALCLIALLSMLAALSDVVRDNLVERIGLMLICLCALGRAVDLHMHPPTPPTSMLFHIALAIYAMGSAWEKFKLWKARQAAERANLPAPFNLAAGQPPQRMPGPPTAREDE